MAKPVTKIPAGADVSKDTIDISCSTDGAVEQIPNARSAIVRWRARFNGPLTWAVESTGSYHELLVSIADEHGDTLYLIDGYRLGKYREAIGARAKTDRADAVLLRRYLESEQRHLRPHKPLSRQEKQVWMLLKRRATTVSKQKDLRQSLAGIESLQHGLAAVIQALQRLINDIERTLQQLVCALGWQHHTARCRAVPGIGPLNAIGLVAAFKRGVWKNADAFIAFLGLDVRVRDSGRFKGRRKLTKKGEAELRRLLYNGAISACQHCQHFKDNKARLLERGRTATAANVIIARKLARLVYVLLAKEVEFDPERLRGACA